MGGETYSKMKQVVKNKFNKKNHSWPFTYEGMSEGLDGPWQCVYCSTMFYNPSAHPCVRSFFEMEDVPTEDPKKSH